MNTENNKIIAEFMGKRIRNSYLEKYIETSENVRFPNGDLIFGWQIEAHESKIKYHSDWNWLMKVVEKIEGLKHCQIDISLNWCRICYKDTLFNYDSRYFFKNLTKIEAVYNACVEFIKWYNQQEK